MIFERLQRLDINLKKTKEGESMAFGKKARKPTGRASYRGNSSRSSGGSRRRSSRNSTDRPLRRYGRK